MTFCTEIEFKTWQKMTRDILVDPSLPHVSYGDTVVTPTPGKCHVLFEWPLRCALKFIMRQNVLPKTNKGLELMVY